MLCSLFSLVALAVSQTTAMAIPVQPRTTDLEFSLYAYSTSSSVINGFRVLFGRGSDGRGYAYAAEDGLTPTSITMPIGITFSAPNADSATFSITPCQRTAVWYGSPTMAIRTNENAFSPIRFQLEGAPLPKCWTDSGFGLQSPKGNLAEVATMNNITPTDGTNGQEVFHVDSAGIPEVKFRAKKTEEDGLWILMWDQNDCHGSDEGVEVIKLSTAAPSS